MRPGHIPQRPIVRKLKDEGLVDFSRSQLWAILKKLLVETHLSKSPLKARPGETGG
jgi:hypothetical protein